MCLKQQASVRIKPWLEAWLHSKGLVDCQTKGLLDNRMNSIERDDSQLRVWYHGPDPEDAVVDRLIKMIGGRSEPKRAKALQTRRFPGPEEPLLANQSTRDMIERVLSQLGTSSNSMFSRSI